MSLTHSMLMESDEHGPVNVPAHAIYKSKIVG